MKLFPEFFIKNFLEILLSDSFPIGVYLHLLVFINLVPKLSLCIFIFISLYQNLDELKQKLGLLPQIATEVDIGDYSYYEINDDDILDGSRKKRVTILIEMMKKEKK